MKTLLINSALCLLAIFTCQRPSYAHCDTYSGPVVQAAQRALETKNINHVLIWVKKKDEDEIEEAFRKALKVRELGPEAKELADKHFFETVVRIHRLGEGASFDGLKTEDSHLGPAIPAADNAIATKNLTNTEAMLLSTIKTSLSKQFDELMKKKNFDIQDVEKGREYVAAYVEFIHFVERIYEASRQPAHGHFEEVGAEHVH